jgi:hypothetical protein
MDYRGVALSLQYWYSDARGMIARRERDTPF